MHSLCSRLIGSRYTAHCSIWHTLKGGLSTNVVETADGTCFVCWHPEKKIPYELTRPLPQPSNECSEARDSPLKMQNSSGVYEVFKEKSPEVIRQELMNITYTTKHRWFPRARDKYAKKTPRDREYL